MAKHHDIKILKKIKNWIFKPNRPSANQLATEIGYSDFNKFASLLVDIAEMPSESVPEAIEKAATIVEARRISKACFRTIAEFVFSVEPYRVPILYKHAINESPTDILWSQLKGLRASSEASPNQLRVSFEEITEAFLRSREKIDRILLDSVMQAGITIYLASRYKDEFRPQDNLTKSVCIPIISSLGLPESVSESSVSRYRSGFESFIRELQPGEPSDAFSPQWWDWWTQVETQIRELAKQGPETFSRFRGVQQLPGSKGLFSQQPETGGSSQKTRNEDNLV